MSLDGAFFESQIRAMQKLCSEPVPPRPLLESHPGFKATRFAKDYYEPVRSDLIGLIPEGARNVLSIGCGWGATEEALAQAGRTVTAIPLDAAIAACAENRSFKVVLGDLTAVLSLLAGQKFDCFIVSNILHLVQDPGAFLESFSRLLIDGAFAIVTVPNVRGASVVWRKLHGEKSYRCLGRYEKSGVHSTSRLRKWLKMGNLKLKAIRHVLPARAARLNRATMGLLKPLLSSEIIVIANKEPTAEAAMSLRWGTESRPPLAVNRKEASDANVRAS
jgi:2-polyprenyl-3-methyl-5-hydroxy-6-metoxy-1,4-benzoquinol methylase